MLRCALTRLNILPVDPRSYTVTERGVTVKYLKAPDIPILLERCLVDVGFVLEEWMVEQDVNLDNLGRIPGYSVSISALVSTCHQDRNLDELWPRMQRPVRIVTSYERMAREFLVKKQLTGWVLHKVQGATEAYVPDIADIAIDCVETGSTLRSNGLRIIDTLRTCGIFIGARRGLSEAEREATQRLADRFIRILDLYERNSSLEADRSIEIGPFPAQS